MSTERSAPTLSDLGRELKRCLRQSPQRHLKVAAVARQIQVSPSTLYAYLAGTTLAPVDVFDRLLLALQVTPDEQRRLAALRDAVENDRRTPRTEAPPAAPRDLPPAPSGFLGRAAERADLDAALAATNDGPTVVVLTGPAGVGKSALALHWAHGRTEQFPDGSLYVDLGGFSPAEPRPSADVLATLLRRLGAADSDVPADPDERASRLRTLLADRRVLLVLDNAYNAEQVRPLLPGRSTSFTVVTSRDELGALHVQPGARRIPVAPLTPDAGLELLRHHLPEHMSRSDAGPPLARRCAGLPLALRIVAAQAQQRPDQELAELLAELPAGLDGFDAGAADASIRAVFSWSEERLSDEDAAAFRTLSLMPGPDVDLASAAALLDVDVRRARAVVERLTQVNLMERSSGRRLRMHDLVRVYALERAEAELPATERGAATARLVDHLGAVGERALALLYPRTAALEPDETFPDPATAWSWIEREWAALVALVHRTVAAGEPALTVRLVDVLRQHVLYGDTRHTEGIALLEHGLAACAQIGDQHARATMLRGLGSAYLRVGQADRGVRHLDEALVLSRQLGDREATAGALNDLGNWAHATGRLEQATDYYRGALEMVERLGRADHIAKVLENLSGCERRLGEYESALDHAGRAMAIYQDRRDELAIAHACCMLGLIHLDLEDPDTARELGDAALAFTQVMAVPGIELAALNILGAAHCRTGRPDEAEKCHLAALDGAEPIDDHFQHAYALEGLGRVAELRGRTREARERWRAAAEVYDRLDAPEADRLRARLA